MKYASFSVAGRETYGIVTAERGGRSRQAVRQPVREPQGAASQRDSPSEAAAAESRGSRLRHRRCHLPAADRRSGAHLVPGAQLRRTPRRGAERRARAGTAEAAGAVRARRGFAGRPRAGAAPPGRERAVRLRGRTGGGHRQAGLPHPAGGRVRACRRLHHHERGQCPRLAVPHPADHAGQELLPQRRPRARGSCRAARSGTTRSTTCASGRR